MRVFIFEHVCGGGLAGRAIPPDLEPLGRAMLRAAVEDFLAIGVDVVTTLDDRLDVDLGAAHVFRINEERLFEPIFQRMALGSDAFLVIAPETDHVLEAWSLRMVSSGVRSLGSSPGAIAIAGDKLDMSARFLAAGVPSPDTMVFDPARGVPPALRERGREHGWVVKPRWGAGCVDTYACKTEADLAAVPPRSDYIIQPIITGLSASATFIVHSETIRPLVPGRQYIHEAGKLSYRGGEIPLAASLRDRAIDLGTRAVRTVPGLNGFVGVDLVLLPDHPESDAVIEINPRLTMSYVGLKAISRTSLARALLDPDAPLEWSGLSVSFDARGKLKVLSPPAGLKKEIRMRMLNRLADVPDREIAARSVKVTARLLELPELANARSVFCFVSMAHELDMRGLIGELLRRGVRVAVPYLDSRGAGLTARMIQSLDECAAAPMGFAQPPATAPELAVPDVTLTPGVAFTPDGRRLGRGAGHYDRYLADHPGSIAIAPALDMQIVESLPTEPHDRRVEKVVTESRTFDCPHERKHERP